MTTQLRQKIVIKILFLFSVFAISANIQATIITTVSGTFSNFSGGDAAYYEGAGSNQAKWGDTSGGLDQSFIEFNGYVFGNGSMDFGGEVLDEIALLDVGDLLNLGSLTLHNGQTLFGSEATDISLDLVIQQFDDITNTIVYENTDSAAIRITTTLNVGDLDTDRDEVCLKVVTTGSTLCNRANENNSISVLPTALLGSIKIFDFTPLTQGGVVTVINTDGTGVVKFLDNNGTVVVKAIPEPPLAMLMALGFGVLVMSKRIKRVS